MLSIVWFLLALSGAVLVFRGRTGFERTLGLLAAISCLVVSLHGFGLF